MKVTMILFLMAAFVAAAADDAACAAGDGGQCDAKEDAQALLQSRVAVSVLDSENDAKMEALGAFRYDPEKASEPHFNDKGYEVFTEVKDACAACDVVCEAKQLKAAFVLCDEDKNNKVTVDEVHDCMFDGDVISKGTKPDHKANVNASDAVLTPAKAAQFVKDHDADGSNDLTEVEFLDARAPPCNEITTLEENSVISTTRAVAKCVSKTVDKITKKITEKCTRSKDTEECWQSWNFWKGSFWECRAKTIIETYDCVKNKIVDVVKEVGAGFAECYKNVIDEVKKEAGGAFMDLLDACSSPDNCKDKLLAGPKKLYDKITDEAKSGLESTVAKEPLRTGVSMTTNLIKKVPGVARDVADVAVDVGAAVVKMVKGSAKAIQEQGNLNMCTPNGYGYWSFAPTDCGAFGRLKDILEITNIANIGSIFEDVVKKFGQCVIKSSILSLPTPFLNVNVNSFCVPDFLQVPIKGIVGSFRYVMAQIAAGINGCSGSSAQQPVCQMVKDIKQIGEKMKTAFSSSLLQQTAEVVGTELHGDQMRYTGGSTSDCAGEDFKVFYELAGTATFPGYGDSVTLSYVYAIGCRNKRLFVDIVFGLGGDLFIAGFKVEPPAKIETGGAVAIGFEIGTPSDDIVSWQGGFKIVGSATVAGATGQVELGLKVLPELDHPKGFKVQPVVKAGSLLERQARQQEIDDAVEKAETIEDKVYMAAGTILKHMRNLDVTEVFQAAQFVSAMRRGAASMKGQGRAGGWPYPEQASLTAGLAVEFCLTCGLKKAVKSAAGANDDDAGALMPEATPIEADYTVVANAKYCKPNLWLGITNADPGACLAEIRQRATCSQSYFNHATNGDGNCGCITQVGVDCTMTSNQGAHSHVRIYTMQATPIEADYTVVANAKYCKPNLWLGITNADPGACLAEIRQRATCSQSYFNHATNGDGNCGCITQVGVDCTMTSNQGAHSHVRIYTMQAQVPDLPVVDGLVLDLRGNNIGVSIGKWRNQVPNGPDADVPNAVTYDSGQKAFHFPGKGAVITVPLATNPSQMSSVTYSAWVKLVDTKKTKAWILTQYPDYGWSRSVTLADSRVGGTGVTPGNWNSGLGSLPTEQWTHVVGVWNGKPGPCVAYANNQKSTSHTCNNGDGSDPNEAFVIGGRGSNDQSHNAEVFVSDVAVFSRALTDTEVTQLYNSGVRPSAEVQAP